MLLLAVGFFLRSQPARLLALGVIALTVAKVFIIDTASISGIYRALSVIGLGVVLLGIGWLYQRLLLSARSGRRRSRGGGCRSDRVTACAGIAAGTLEHEPGGVTFAPPDTYIGFGKHNVSSDQLVP